MPFTPKDWKDLPDVTTPLSAAALEDMETRLAAYTDTRVDAEAATRASANTAQDSVIESNYWSVLTNSQDYTRGQMQYMLAPYRTILERRSIVPSGSKIQGTCVLTNGGSIAWAADPADSPTAHTFYFNKNDYISSNEIPNLIYKMRLVVTWINGAAALNTNITVNVASPGSFTSNANGVGMNLGAGPAPPGGTVTINSGVAINAVSTAISSDFYAADMNASNGANIFCISAYAGAAISNTNSNSVCIAQLQGHYVPTT